MLYAPGACFDARIEWKVARHDRRTKFVEKLSGDKAEKLRENVGPVVTYEGRERRVVGEPGKETVAAVRRW